MFAYLTAFASATASPDTGLNLAGLVNFLPIIAIIVVFYFMIIRPQRKKDKETKSMLSAVKVGDKITTIGGIVGKIIKVKENQVTLETGSGNDKATVVIAKWAIQSVDKVSEKSYDPEVIEGEIIEDGEE